MPNLFHGDKQDTVEIFESNVGLSLLEVKLPLL